MASAVVPVKITTISAGKFRRYKHFRTVDYITTPSVMLQNIIDIAKIVAGTVQSLWIVLRYRPDVVFAKGGFVCLPVGWAARLLRVSVVIHDSDARPGLTNRLLASFAGGIATGYPLENYPYQRDKSIYTGVPIRKGYKPVSNARQNEAKRALDIDPVTPLIVGVGGGLGARSINSAMVRSASDLADTGAKFVIVAGKKYYPDTQDEAGNLPNIEVLEFVTDGLLGLLSAADIVVTRASATSLQELACLRKAIIAVPARQLSDQHENAKQYAEKGAAIVLDDDALEQGELTGVLRQLLDDEKSRNSLAEALHEFARPNAAKEVAKLIIDTSDKNR